MFARSICFFLLLLIVGVARADTILIWGDSLSAGYGLASGQAWPTLLQTRLKEKGFNHSVVNASVSGETTSGGLSRLPDALQRHKPGIVVLELGANDGLRGLPLPQMEVNLRQMVDAIRSSGARVLLVGMQLPPNFGPGYTRRFADTYSRVAGDLKIPFLPFLFDGMAQRQELFQQDNLHPTAEAQPLLMDNVWKQLQPLLKR